MSEYNIYCANRPQCYGYFSSTRMGIEDIRNDAYSAGWRFVPGKGGLVCPACYKNPPNKPHVIVCENRGCMSRYNSVEKKHEDAVTAAITFGFKMLEDNVLVCPSCSDKSDKEKNKIQVFKCQGLCKRQITCRDIIAAQKEGWGYYYGSLYCPEHLAKRDREPISKSPVTIEQFAKNLVNGMKEAYKNNHNFWPSFQEFTDIIEKAAK